MTTINNRTPADPQSRIEAMITDDLDIVDKTLPDPESQQHKSAPADDSAESDENPEDTEALATDEDAEASEGDAQDDEEADTEDDEPEAKAPTYKVKVDGEELEVTLEELQGGYSRTKDYTRKAQELAEQRRAAEAVAEEMRESRAAYAEMLEKLAVKMEGELGAEPDWDKLQLEDPIEYGIQYANWQRKQAKIYAARAEQERVAQEEMQSQREVLVKRLKDEQGKLLTALPAWKDEAVAKKERTELFEYGKTIGFTEADLNNIGDHRAILALRKAMLYDRGQSQKPELEKKIKKGPVIAPGSGNKKTQTPKAKAIQQFRKTRRLEDAAKVVGFLIED